MIDAGYSVVAPNLDQSDVSAILDNTKTRAWNDSEPTHVSGKL